MPFEQGPYLKMAVLCERALQERDGAISVIRVVDRVTQVASGTNAPEEMPPLTGRFTAVIMLVAGSSRGSSELRIDVELPMGITRRVAAASVFLEGEERATNLLLNLAMTFRSPGLYWFNLYLDNQFLTRIPLRVMYQRISQGNSRPIDLQ